jgi:peptidoglycan/xylan/chitin deacetylase (PgdA/CDA1 family)
MKAYALARGGCRRWVGLCLAFACGFLGCITARSALAADCPGHPDALGTSRTLVVDPRQHPRIGTMQYAETLPLRDHEVVLTFDDGPLPRNSNQILALLASQCVKATFFTVGQMARSFPEGVRKLVEAGHSVGTHSQNHPSRMDQMPIERAQKEIDEGIASVKAALGDDAKLAPFFRIPGLRRAEAVEEYLASQGIQVWSADFPADDWRTISSSRVYDLAMKRLEAKGKGILLLHDIQARTVAALPRILHELKARGYRIVHVVPATPQNPATATEPQDWMLHPISENVATSHWPKIPGFVFAYAGSLPAPELWGLERQDKSPTLADDNTGRFGQRLPMLRHVSWLAPISAPAASTGTALPAPSASVFEIKEGLRAVMAGPIRRAEQAPMAHAVILAEHGHVIRVKPHRAERHHTAAHNNSAHAGRRTPKRLLQDRKRSA